MQLYNTLTRKKEPLVPLRDGKIHMYVCGITAYDFCHIGHARSALVFDVLTRHLRGKGLDVFFVRNFTDVDDKIINRALAEGRDWREVAQTFMAAFHEDMDKLGILRADAEPRATEHIGAILDMCAALVRRGNAYATPSGDVYFRVRSFSSYGKLSGRDPDELRAGARVPPGEEKEDPLDFALWKAAKPGEPFWDSPWGKGRPGWHIECSAMSEEYLPLDIHGGGQDLVFPHHENEAAQTKAATGKDLARCWVHNGFVQIDSEKMSKSLGNFKTIRDILKICLPETLRFFLLGKHYRSPIDFSSESLEAAEKAQKRVYECLLETEQALRRDAWKNTPLPEDMVREFDALIAAFDEAMEDDCNTALALGQVFALVRLANRMLEDKTLRSCQGTRDLLKGFHKAMAGWTETLGLFGQSPPDFLAALRERRAARKGVDAARVAAILEERQQARQEKNFVLSDQLRDQLTNMGVELRDTPAGPVWDIA